MRRLGPAASCPPSSQSDQAGSGAAIAVGALHLQRPRGTLQRRGDEAGASQRCVRLRRLGRDRVGERSVSPATIATITAPAAGAILAMLADTMIPEAYERAVLYTGLITTIGFLTAFTLHLTGG